nr:peptidylprolyl isomerase [Gracilibacillus halophilus]
MKKLAMATTFAASVIALSACSSDDESETVVETGSGNITKDEFYEELKSSNGGQVLQQMVLKTILEDNYDVSDEEVDQEVQSLKDQYGDQWEMVLAQSGLEDEDALREQLRTSLLQQKAVTEDVEVSDEEINQRYERMQTELVASHILVQDEETANTVKEELDNGEDFASLAEEYSTDQASASNGGELDPFTAGDMAPAFEDAAYNLETDEVSDPVQSDNGWHIIKLQERNEVEVEPLEDMKDQIRSEIAQTKVEDSAAQTKMQELMQDADIDVKIDEFESLFEQQTSTGSSSGSGSGSSSEESSDAE